MRDISARNHEIVADSLSMGALSVVLIAPDEEQRRAMAQALVGPQANVVREFLKYPEVDQLGELVNKDYDVVLVHLEPDAEAALDVVETLCRGGSALTVMVYSSRQDPQMMLRCMRAGAREFLTDLRPAAIAEALVRASARRDETRRKRVSVGKLLVFAGAKGGSGVTTLASNVAVAMSRYAKVALVDLDLELGDAAVTLGMSNKFSMVDALENLSRVDGDFIRGLMIQHESGLSVLGAPDSIPPKNTAKDGVGALLRTVREDFAYVVVDAGSRSFEHYEPLFEAATTVYLVTQVSVPDLRNANRFVTRYFSGAMETKLEIILNRHVSRNPEIDEAAITKALTVPARWKVPNDYAAVMQAQNTGIPVLQGKNRVAGALSEIAKAARGEVDTPAKKKILGLF